ncbi:MAG: dihydrofolate reductase [Oceanicoccus sp.]|jgi:dihydrofolate reductase
MAFHIIAAMDLNRGIGKNNKLPWALKADMAHFKKVTTNTSVIMGRKTWESLPERFRPLPSRQNIVLTRNPDLSLPEGVIKAGSLDQALALASMDHVYVIGGATLYKEAILHKNCKGMSITLVNGEFECDAFFPEIPSNMKQRGSTPFYEEEGVEFSFMDYRSTY